MSTPDQLSIRERVLLVICAVTTEARRFKELEERTKVPAQTWRSFWNREGALPSGAMLEELGREWPQFAFWIMTGIDDWEAGHVAPPTATHLSQERISESKATTAYFMSRVKLENGRRSSIPADVSQALRAHALTDKAVELLGGYVAIEEIRKGLEERGVMETTERKLPSRLSDLLKHRADPILDRAVEALERELEQQAATELASLKAAREAELRRRGSAGRGETVTKTQKSRSASSARTRVR